MSLIDYGVSQMTRIRELDPADAGVITSDQRILRMTPDGQTETSIESLLHLRLDELAQAVRDKDLERLMSFYSSDLLVFDVLPPLLARGTAAYRQNFERWFNSFEGPLKFEFKDLRIVPGESIAFCHYLALVSGARSSRLITGYWVRGTTCFELRNGEWLITHEHISLPAEK